MSEDCCEAKKILRLYAERFDLGYILRTKTHPQDLMIYEMMRKLLGYPEEPRAKP